MHGHLSGWGNFVFIALIVFGAVTSWQIMIRRHASSETTNIWRFVLLAVAGVSALASGAVRGVPGSGNVYLIMIFSFFAGLFVGIEIYSHKR